LSGIHPFISATFGRGFAKFYENPSREGLRELLRNNSGELSHLDFKLEWPIPSKLARHILGLANLGGGCIIIGVGEKPDKVLESKGLTSFTDNADIIKGIKKFLPNNLLSSLQTLNFSYDAAEYPALIGKKFQVVIIEGASL
jgi:hypothetical protein